MAAILGHQAKDLQGHSLFDYLDPNEQEQVRALFERRQLGVSDQFDMRFRRADGAAIWTIVSAAPVSDAHGAFAGSLAMVTDISSRKRAEEADAFLVDAAGILASSLDYEKTLAEVADLAASRVGDWCQIGLKSEDGELRIVAVSHRNPARAEMARRLAADFPDDPERPRGAARVASTGRPELVSFIDDAWLAEMARSPEHLERIRRLDLRAYVCVPISARDVVLGSLAFASAESRRRYDETDLLFAQRLAALAAMAIENARLYREAQEAIRMRDDFLSVASHELRTPLTSLALEIERLLSGIRAG